MTPRRLKVLFSVPAPSDRSNPYTTLLADSVAQFADVSFFSWKLALFGRYDIFHVHWPETIVRGRSAVSRAIRLGCGFLLLARLRLTKTPLVWTVHNLQPHESGSRWERLYLKKFYTEVACRIYINDDPANEAIPGEVILHGTYSDWFDRLDAAGAELATIDFLYFGMVRPYKGVESFLRAARELEDQGASFHTMVVGAPVDAHYAASISAAAAELTRASLDLRRASDERLRDVILASRVVVLPYRQLYNSGSVLLALSLGRHVLAPWTPATQALLAEFGDKWVSLFRGDLKADDLRDAHDKASKISSEERPDMLVRQWSVASARLSSIYRRLVGREVAQ